MANAHDVAAYILERHGQMSAMKLQKLVYYAQAWHLVWEDGPLFRERIEAWANGPVTPALYRRHRGTFTVSHWPAGTASKLTDTERETIAIVLDTYGKRDASWLSELTHLEAPWRDARKGLGPGTRGTREITPAALAEYYSSIADDGTEV